MAINAKPRGYLFDEVLDSTPDRSAFDLSHRLCTSCNFDYLYPILCEEVLPNSDYELAANIFMRTAPMVAPVYQDIDVKLYHFWVPARTIFRDWEKLISNGDGTRSIAEVLDSKLVNMPFVTNVDLAYRGNQSYTNTVAYDDDNAVYKDESIRHSFFNILDVRDVSYHAISGTLTDYEYYGYFSWHKNGISAGSLADHLGIPDDGYSLLWSPLHDTYAPFVDGNFDNVFMPISWAALVGKPWADIRSQTSVAATIAGHDSNYTYKNIRTYNSMPFRAYNKIYYDWFRDENLQPDGYVNTLYEHNTFVFGGILPERGFTPIRYRCYIYDPDLLYYATSGYGADNQVIGWDKDLNVGLLRKSYAKDYITSALQSPQRGADITLPVSGSARLVNNNNQASKIVLTSTGTGPGSSVNVGSTQTTGTAWVGSAANTANIDITSHTKIDLSNVTSLTIEALRVANKMQQFLEKFARTGSRYVEMMLSHFDVMVPDAASRRPTLIGTARIPVQISANSSESSVQIDGAVIPQGTQTGIGMSNGNTGYRFHADEHGYLMTLLCIEPRTYYGSSLPRHYLRRGWLDYAWPQFANLGEQPVYNCEVYPTSYRFASDYVPDIDELSKYDLSITQTDLANMTTYGYQSRYCDYKYVQDRVAGDFKGDLDYWTLARWTHQVGLIGDNIGEDVGFYKYWSRPVLNAKSIRMDVNDRQNIFATVDDEQGDSPDHFYFDIRYNFKAIKTLPLYGTPSL